ncbi:MAG: hypothetical protein ABI305_13010, partial [Tepidiformaceae bacterium]
MAFMVGEILSQKIDVDSQRWHREGMSQMGERCERSSVGANEFGDSHTNVAQRIQNTPPSYAAQFPHTIE